MTQITRIVVFALDEALHDLRAIESEAMDCLSPRCSFRGFIDVASLMDAVSERMPHLVVIGDLPRAGFAAGGLHGRLRSAGYQGPIAIVSREVERLTATLAEREHIIAAIAKKDFSRALFQSLIRQVAEGDVPR